MSTIPSNLSRVPNMLSSQLMLGSLTQTNQSLLQLQTQLTSMKSVNRVSDNPVAASTIAVLDDVIERRDQVLRNLNHGEAVLNNIDAALSDANALVLDAQSIGLGQVGSGGDAATRATEAVVIDSIVNQMIAIANRKYHGTYLFGGSDTANAPMAELLGGVQYIGQGKGLVTDTGLGLPITVGGEAAFGTMSARVQGARDLEPTMTGQTRLADLNGARGLGVTLGAVNANINGVNVVIDLAGAHSVQDIINKLEEGLHAHDPDATVAIDPNGRALTITPGAGVDITISDTPSDAFGGVAADMGIRGTFLGGATTTGQDVAPKLVPGMRLEDLNALDLPLGMIRITNGNQTRELDLSGAETVEDIINAVQALNLGVRVEINEANDRLNFVNTLSGGLMSVEEVNGGDTATQLGVRSFSGATLLSDFNHGQGVDIRSDSVDPITGDLDPDADVDFRITLKNGDTIDVDLAGAVTIQNVLDLINEAADNAGVDVPGDFIAGLAADGNGIELTDNTVPAANATTVAARNGSFAADDLGILGTTGENGGATLTGEDRATVAVDSVISHLIMLRDALKGNDSDGIALATSKLEGDLDRLTQTRAEVGVRTRRIIDAVMREEDLNLQDVGLKSQLQDLDYTEAALRFSVLQQQLQAGLQSASMVSSLSLLDFLR